MTAVDPRALPVASELAKRLGSHVEYLASPKLQGRKPGTRGHRSAADYIVTRFREIGLEPLPSLKGYGQPVRSDLGENLIGVRPALLQAPARWFLLGAHYDHLGGQYLGADDNASAIAIVIETARLLLPLPHHSIAFIAFNTEEPPYIRTSLMGSQYFVNHLPVEIGSIASIQAVIIMDLMGGVHWEPLRNVVFAAGAEKSPELYRRLREATGRDMSGTSREVVSLMSHNSPLMVLPMGMHLIEEIPLVGRVSFSDYDAFRNVSVPFLFLSAGRTPRYHQPSDLPDTLHYERMAATVEWLRTLLRLIDQDLDAYRFDARRLALADEVASLRPLAALAADRNTSIPGTSPLSLWRMQHDHRWLQGLNAASPTRDDIKRLEHLSLRIQCLLADFSGCFLL